MKIPGGFRGTRGPVAVGLALLLSLALLQPMLTSASERKPTARTGKAQQPTPNGKAKKVAPLPPERGVPNLNLPNLDQVRQRQRSEPQAPAPIQSTIRSRRKSGKPASDKKLHHARLRNARNSNSRHQQETEIAPLPSGPPPFTNDPLKNPNDPDSFKIQAVHITELRAAINTVRNRRHLPDYSWVKPTASGGAINSNVLISWEPIDEMRTALNQAIGPPATPYTGGLAQGQPILAVHLQELRERVKDILGVTSIADQLVPSRVDLFNQSGNQIEARDCEWGLPLVSLPGRAGLDLNIGLSYSSMVWTQAGSYISFDDDWGDPSPGFKIGFPTIQGRFTNNLIGANVYILIASAGRRVELRRVGSSNIYEAGDSSYLQLIDNGSSLSLRTTDGTQMSYAKSGSDWHCRGVEDRNGNVILANYNTFGDITDITDTLGRTFTFIYDGNYNLQTITQTWTVNGVAATHTWATFGWGTVTMHPAFSGVNVVGVFDGEVVPVLTQVGLADGSHYNFDYNDYGQVRTISLFAADGAPGNAGDMQRSYFAYNYEYPSGDCPRINQLHVWAQNWSDVGGVPHEVISYFADNHDGSHQMTTPDGTVYKEFYGGSGDLPAWKHGLVTSTQVISDSTAQKTTTTSWTQDNEGVNYQTNPRVSQTLVSDGTNNRKTTIGYQTFALPVSSSNCSLPNDVSEFDADQSTVLRHTHSHYLPDVGYLDNSARGNRLIGLQDETDVYQGPGTTTLVAKITYAYDQTAVSSQAITAAGHDQSYDNSSAAALRGNLTGVSRFDVSNGAATTTSMTYDAAGNLLSRKDAANHTSSIVYTDSFSDGNNHNTFAYPTTLIDADGYSSYVQYNYDFSAQTRTQGPPPGNPGQYANGIIQTFSYDEAARLKQVTTTNSESGAYVHYDYGPDYTSSFASVNSVAANYWESDSYTNRFFDGLGRVFAVASNHPNSQGGNKAQWTEYDVMGRAKRVSNPTEIDSSWNPTGDDSNGRVYTAQTYDWKGRPLVTTHETDGTTKYASYAGCGCAGGEVVTLTDEVGRQQKVYSDILGRQVKTEVLQTVNNATSVYSSVVNTYNVRDQVTLVRQWAGAENGGGAYQDTTMSYDGYGRLASKHVPEQRDQSANPTYTTFSYYDDDTIHTVTDARSAVSTYLYNGRHQITSATNVLSGQPTISSTFEYDAVGNRNRMTDGIGQVDYSYDTLSRLKSETHYFSALSSSSTGGNYTINYQYNLANELTSITDPFGAQIGYTRDTVGRTTAVTGSGFANVTSYVSNIQYRAWGAVKSASYGDPSYTTNRSSTTQYNGRMQPTQFRLRDNTYDFSLISENYAYYDDGRVSSVTDLDDTAGNNPPATLRFLSRSFGYDQSGRVIQGYSPNTAPVRQTYGYDEFGNMTSRSGSYYWQAYQSATFSYTNNRHDGWSYDLNGQVLSSPATATDSAQSFYYDASGFVSRTVESATNRTVDYRPAYDGDGKLTYEWSQTTQNGSSAPAISSYSVRSTVLGGDILTKLDQNGNKSITNVPAEGLLFATQSMVGGASVTWTQRDPLGITETEKGIYDPLGNYIPFQQHDDPRPPAGSYNSSSMSGIAASVSANPFGSNTGCLMDGIPTDCARVLRAINNGQGDKVAVYGFSLSLELSEFTASYASVTTTGTRKHVPPFRSYYVGYRPPPKASNAAVQFVITPGFQLGFEPNPQDPKKQGPSIEDDKEQLTSPGTNCGITVNFNRGGHYRNRPDLLTGPSIMPNPGNPKESSFGLGFMVSGWANTDGGVGHRDLTDGTRATIPSNPGGSWTITQTTAAYISLNGVVKQNDQQMWTDMLPGSKYDVIGNTFYWYDHPGSVHTTGVERREVFKVSVSNGTETCSLTFHFIQNGTTIDWGEGGLP